MSAVLELERLLDEIAPDSPAGDDLEYDPAFIAMEQAARGRPEQGVGDSVTPAEPPDWKTVRKQALELLGRSKDLRTAVYLTRALIHEQGYAGLQKGLELIDGLLLHFWDTLHPQLDEEDDNDPTFRVNTLLTLCDREAVLTPLRNAPLVESRALGRFGLHEIAIARGELPAPEEGDAPNMGLIESAFLDAELSQLQDMATAIAQSRNRLSSMDTLLMEKLGSGQAPDFGPLDGLLREAQAVLSKQLARRGQSGGDGEAQKTDMDTGQGASAVSAGQVGVINSREDAARMMDLIAEYFRIHEPSSPVPLLMQRAKRLSNMDFLDILKDVAPDGLAQAKNIGGIRED